MAIWSLAQWSFTGDWLASWQIGDVFGPCSIQVTGDIDLMKLLLVIYVLTRVKHDLGI